VLFNIFYDFVDRRNMEKKYFFIFAKIYPYLKTQQLMQNDAQWSVSHKIIFYFFFLFFVLNIFPFPISVIPFLEDFIYENIILPPWNFIVKFTGRIFFDLKEITNLSNGSGDTTWDWIQQFSILLMSAVGTFIWFFVAKNRDNHSKLSHWFIILLRYYLGYVMLSYGFAKVFPLQFGNITTYRLYERLGEMSPMGLLWTFMAYSQGYQFFGGLTEVIGGLLLFFKRTTTLGALICIGVLVNIFALNIFYDVPVKIYSFWLLLIGLYLAFDDFKRLWSFFIMNQATESKKFDVFFENKWFKIGKITLKILFIVGVCGEMFYDRWKSVQYKDTPKTAIYGAYKVEKFEKNNVVSESDTLRWQEFFIDRRGARDLIFVTNQDGLRKRVDFRNDTKNQQLFMTNYTSTTDTVKYAFSYFQVDSSSLYLKGKIKTDSFKVSMKKMDRKGFLLKTRGFHWINEFPFNK
jgi:uncharacterized membrane protein YphA (DoxX/SURF4 family)